MKKYFLGFIALIILVVSFSAFVSKDNDVKAAATEESLYWYPVKPNGLEIDHNALINPSVKLTKTQMRVAGLIPCTEASGNDCIRGFSSQQATDVTSPGVDRTKKP